MAPRRKKTNKDPTTVINQKLRKTKHDKSNLLQKFNDDFESLKDHYNKYKQCKHPKYKIKFSAYNKLNRLNSKIRKLTKQLDDVIVKCANCNRRPNPHLSSPDYQMCLQPVSSNLIFGKRTYSFVQSTRQSDNPINYQLCQQCTIHLSDKDSDKANEPQVIWPSFYWAILQSTDIHKCYNSKFIWGFIPLIWRKWWYDEIKLQFPIYYDHSISLLQPDAFFVDRTEDLNIWNNAMECQQLSSIADVCNRFLLPTVLCPWGCSEFLHCVGFLDIDTIMQRFIEKCDLSIVDAKKKLSKVVHTRDDFIRDSIDDYDMWLCNLNWQILPTVVFVNGYPRVLTCKDHDNGCNLIQIHCCRWRSNISAPISDQICHAVVKPRTVKNMKVGYNSTGYQMVEQRSSWKGPDSINVSSVGKTDHGSILVQEAEARSYANRTDMKNLIQRLIDDGKMSIDHAEGIEEFSNFFSTKVNYEKYKSGSNYVPAEIAMSMKEEEKNREVSGIIDDDQDDLGNLLPEYNKKFKRIWPLYSYPCQKITSHGASMYAVPPFQVAGSSFLWTISSLLLHIESLWYIIAKGQMRRSEWQGYLLMYLTKKCLSHLNRRAVGIFQVMNITDLISLFEGFTNLGKFMITILII